MLYSVVKSMVVLALASSAAALSLKPEDVTQLSAKVDSVKSQGVDHHDPGSQAQLCDSKLYRADCIVHGSYCVWKIDPTVVPGGGECLVGAVP